MKAEAQVLKGHLDTLLLASLANGPLHGYAVREALRAGSCARFDLPTGTIYPALRRLEAAGLVRGTWSEAGGRRRRTYELTPAGRQRLSRDRAAWRDFAAAMNTILEPAR
ncbi:MAG: helix-turn-helix transcriptional regulator [Actinomycetota bacterium]|nr:helix-turn-helix transcriptional regulator [Actinomycetota bacterium]